MLQQYLETQNISQNRLARAIRVSPRRINEIVLEKRAITADTAVRLAHYFGGSATYWLHLQAEYDIEKIRERIKAQLNTIQAPTSPYQAPVTEQVNTRPGSKIRKHLMR